MQIAGKKTIAPTPPRAKKAAAAARPKSGRAGGLRKNQNKTELGGLMDMSSAVGLSMLTSGIGVMPGLAVFSTAQTVKTIYGTFPLARKLVDPLIDKLEPGGLKALGAVDQLKGNVQSALERLKNPFPDLFGEEDEAAGRVSSWGDTCLIEIDDDDPISEPSDKDTPEDWDDDDATLF